MEVIKFTGVIERLAEEGKFRACWKVWYDNWKSVPIVVAGMARTFIIQHQDGVAETKEEARKIADALFKKEVL